jgi:hypothetical protein
VIVFTRKGSFGAFLPGDAVLFWAEQLLPFFVGLDYFG